MALAKLDTWSFTIFKKFLDARAIFAGSDFDIDQAVRAALNEIDEIDFRELKSLAGLQPILAKRHYHETGALRWFDINIVPVSGLVEFAAHLEPDNGAIGQFLLAIPTEEKAKSTRRACAVRRRVIAMRGISSAEFQRDPGLSCRWRASCLRSTALATITRSSPAIPWRGARCLLALRPCKPCLRRNCTRRLIMRCGSARTTSPNAYGRPI